MPQESYLLANTVFCLSLHKHLEVVNMIFHSQLVRDTKHLWPSCSFTVIFPPRWPYACSHQHSLRTTMVPLKTDFWKEGFTTIIYSARLHPALRCEILLRPNCSDIPTVRKRNTQEFSLLKLLIQDVFQIILIGAYKHLRKMKIPDSKELI